MSNPEVITLVTEPPLKWEKPQKDRAWQDGTVILAAVNVMSSGSGKQKWHYEKLVIVMDDDDPDLSYYESGDAYLEWDLKDINFVSVLTGGYAEGLTQ